ncbi:MAG: ABC transporter substrate-binding protein [Fervidobacterium sp.]|uniref:ABC transporter substrate-binding protein n=1 Tax=Fervidobacterium sp. TaxID=1871331 RepID=UPI0040491414
MRRHVTRLLLLGLLVVFSLSVFAKVTITASVWSWDVEKYKKIVAEFNKYYPDIEVVLIVNEPDVNGFLTARVSAKQPLPDVVVQSWEALPYPVSQGWIYPVDEFLKNDADLKYMPLALRQSFVYNGKTYALPERLHFQGIVMNLDLLKKLNLQAPKYEAFTVNIFKNYLRKATTREYSGINHLWDFDNVEAAVLSKDTTFWGFNPKKWEFELATGGWLPAIKLQKELKSVPGLVSDDLKNDELRNKGELDDYQKKFGKDADAFRESKVLMGLHGTWDWSWVRTLPWNLDYYPMPFEPQVGQRIPVHVNYAFMTSTTKYPKEAFAFLRFLTYDPRGVVARLKIDVANGEENGRLIDWFVPATMHPDVIKYFDTLKIPNGVKWMLKNLDKAVRVDMWKTVPGWDQATWDVIFPVSEKVRRGEVQPETVAVETQEKANKIIKDAWSDFSKKLSEVEKKFPEIRKQVEGK